MKERPILFSGPMVRDERERCALCTAKHGPAEAMPGYVKHIVQGVYGAPPK